MKEILQRLEMTKHAIMLEDEDIIELQINRLSQLPLDSEAEKILALLKVGSFEIVIGLIEDYRQSKMGLVSYEDEEVYGLRLELKILESEYEDLSLKKIGLESLINDFNSQYHQRCGELIELILSYRSQLQQRSANENPEDLDKAEAFEEAQQDYEEFHKEYKETINELPVELSADDQKSLKTAYRKASRLCHPDKVSDEFKDQAAEIFKQLSEAYKSKDLEAVKNILESLESQKRFSAYSDILSNAKKLRIHIAELKTKIASKIDSIDTIKSDETYEVIVSIIDWDDYFTELRNDLSKELIKLQDTIKNPAVP